MAAPRRKISQAERKDRDALDRVRNLVHVMVIRRLFDDGWTIEKVALAYKQILNEIGRLTIAHAKPDLPPLNGTTSRERIWGWSKPREATNATRKEGTG